MFRYIHIVILTLCTLAFPVSAKAQYYSVNFDYKTVAEMAVAFNAEAAVEIYYEEQLSNIRDHYEAAEVAAAGIFASKFLDRKALTNMGLWTSSTENYYYRRIYNMVSAKIMPKIWTIAKMMLRNPQNALYWGSYLYKVCEETKNLCYQFESIVTNSTLSFKDIAFLEINEHLASLFKLSELAHIDWKAQLDKFSHIGESFTKEKLREDVGNLYSMGANLASAGASSLASSILGSSNFSGSMMEKTSSAIEIAENVYHLYDNLTTNTGSTLLSLIGGKDSVNNLFSLSNYNVTSWLTDYAHENMGQYYTQRYYIYRVDKGSVRIFDYYPPTDDESVVHGSAWTRYATTVANYKPTSSQNEEILRNSENHAGYTREMVKQMNNAKDGFVYRFDYYRIGYDLKQGGKVTQASFAYEIHVTKTWNNKYTVYEDVFDSYTMDLTTFKNGLEARLTEYNDNDDGYTYYIGSDSKKYYQATDAQKIAGCETATISISCHDGAKLGDGSTQYKCNSCGSSINGHTKECAMLTTVTEIPLNTTEFDTKIAELERQIASLQTEITALEQENSELIKKISSSSVEDAATYRQQYNANKDRINSLSSQMKTLESRLQLYEQAKQETLDSESVQTDDYYRLPAVMQDCKSAYNLNWNSDGHWDGNSYIRTATIPNIKGTVTFKATISMARKPQYFLGIKIHRAIIKIAWEVTSEYSDTQIVAILNLDPAKSDAEKADEVNQKLSEVATQYPDCDPNVEYAKNDVGESDNTDDTYHLLWSSDRLEIAREIDSRLTHIFADLVSLEKMMHYKHSVLDMIRTILPYINDEQGKRLTLVEKCRKRWLRYAANSAHSDSYNGKYEEEEDAYE